MTFKQQPEIIIVRHKVITLFKKKSPPGNGLNVYILFGASFRKYEGKEQNFACIHSVVVATVTK